MTYNRAPRGHALIRCQCSQPIFIAQQPRVIPIPGLKLCPELDTISFGRWDLKNSKPPRRGSIQRDITGRCKRCESKVHIIARAEYSLDQASPYFYNNDLDNPLRPLMFLTSNQSYHAFGPDLWKKRLDKLMENDRLDLAVSLAFHLKMITVKEADEVIHNPSAIKHLFESKQYTPPATDLEISDQLAQTVDLDFDPNNPGEGWSPHVLNYFKRVSEGNRP